MEGFTLGKARVRCASSKGLEHCEQCKQGFYHIMMCEEWKEHMTLKEKIKRKLWINSL